MKAVFKIIILTTLISLINGQAPINWPSNKPYWDMPADSTNSLDMQASRSLKKTLEYQLNPFHQPNEIYGKETCHGGGDHDGFGIGQSDVDAANAGTNHFALDVTGNITINNQDATEIQNYLNKTTPYLQFHWNFLSENEKESWFMKIADIYSLNDERTWTDGDVNTRYISGNYATEFCIRMQGYNQDKTDALGGTRKPIMDKYDKEFNGKGNIPTYFVVIYKYDDDGNIVASHGMNSALKGNNPLIFNDWMLYDPQVNGLVFPGDWTGAVPFNSSLSIYKLENFGGQLAWGDDMPSTFLGDSVQTSNTTMLLKFKLDSNGNPSVDWYNEEKLITTKPTVSIGRESSVPKSFKLEQNFPNPFNPSTIIEYSLNISTEVEFYIYDLTGYLVDKINIGYMSVGNHEIQYNSYELASGIYFYQLDVDGQLSTPMKMTVLK